MTVAKSPARPMIASVMRNKVGSWSQNLGLLIKFIQTMPTACNTTDPATNQLPTDERTNSSICSGPLRQTITAMK